MSSFEDEVDRLIRDLVTKDRVTRHDYDISTSTMAELEETGFLDRDDAGFLTSGPYFDLHVGMGLDSDRD